VGSTFIAILLYQRKAAQDVHLITPGQTVRRCVGLRVGPVCPGGVFYVTGRVIGAEMLCLPDTRRRHAFPRWPHAGQAGLDMATFSACSLVFVSFYCATVNAAAATSDGEAVCLASRQAALQRWCWRLRLAAGEAARDHRVVGFTVAAPWSRSRELELLAVALSSGSFGNPWVASQGSERKLRIMAPVAAMLTSVALVGIVVGSLFVLGLWVKTLVPSLDSAAMVLHCIVTLL
jgi:hypothetical protein